MSRTTQAEDAVIAERVAELAALEGWQRRIDCIAADLAAGTNRYAVIDAWALGELVGLSLADAGDGSWCHSFWAYSRKPEDDNDGLFPLAEHVELLEGKVSKTRFNKLTTLATAIIEKGEGEDLPLTEKEEELLRDEYQREHGGGDGVTVASNSVESTTGVELEFEVMLTDGEPDSDAWSPYDLARGQGFDSSDFFLLDS